MKCINPFTEYTYSHPSAPETVFTFTAYAGHLIPSPGDNPTEFMLRQYLRKCLIRVTNIEVYFRNNEEVPETGETKETIETRWFDMWDRKRDVLIEWDNVLPPAIQNALFLEISKVSKLTAAEKRDLQ